MATQYVMKSHPLTYKMMEDGLLPCSSSGPALIATPNAQPVTVIHPKESPISKTHTRELGLRSPLSSHNETAPLNTDEERESAREAAQKKHLGRRN